MKQKMSTVVITVTVEIRKVVKNTTTEEFIDVPEVRLSHRTAALELLVVF